MANLIKTKRGLDIRINGRAKETVGSTIISETIAILPDDYHGVTPKVVVKEGDEVKAGSPLFNDKTFDTMNFVSPVSGKVLAVNRGERRKVMSVTIQSDKKNAFESFDVKPVEKLNMSYRDWETKLDRKSTRLNSSHRSLSRMPSSA